MGLQSGYVKKGNRMTGWLKRMLFGYSEGTWHPGKMKIYHYWDGSKWMHRDPMTLYKEVMSVGPELAIDIKVANSPVKDEDKKKAHDEMISKMQKIFLVVPVEQGGLTQIALVELFDDFMEYCEGVKKNSSPSLTSSTSEVLEHSSKGDSPTTNSSESGSVENVSNAVGPA